LHETYKRRELSLSPFDPICFYILKIFLKNLNFILFFSLLQINIFLIFLNHFDVLILKMIFKK